MTKRARTKAPRAESVMTDAIPKFELNELSRIDFGDRAESISESISDDEVVEVTDLPTLAPMTYAAFEGPTHLASAQHAIAASGHACVIAATGHAGLGEVSRAIARDAVDAIFVALPGGEALLDAALARERRPVIIASCAGAVQDAIARATAAGADLVAMRPHSEDRLAPILLATSRLHEVRRAAREPDLLRRVEQVSTEVGALHAFAVFQRLLEHELRRARRYAYPLTVALFAVEVVDPPTGVRGILRARAGNALIHAIRDIDVATELDGEQFLVMMPYTDLGVATEVARRIITAVGACDPVVMIGRQFPARLIGAVAGARHGQPLSFARLMKDATRALEQARQDGIELAVQA